MQHSMTRTLRYCHHLGSHLGPLHSTGRPYCLSAAAASCRFLLPELVGSSPLVLPVRLIVGVTMGQQRTRDGDQPVSRPTIAASASLL